jgi:hypothetical protein
MARHTQEQLPSPPFVEANAEQSTAMEARRERQEVRVRHAAADWTETENDDEDSDEEQNGEREGRMGSYDGSDNGHSHNGSEDGDEATPLLPIFSTAPLGIRPS